MIRISLCPRSAISDPLSAVSEEQKPMAAGKAHPVFYPES
jgi:hypothetical protein